MVWETRRRELKSAPYELFVILVTVLSIVNLVLAFALRTNQAMQDILKVMNIVLSLILFCDFVYRFATADARAAYFWKGFGWADLFASLPIPAAFLLRTFRLVRVSRLLRKQGLRAVALELGERRAGSTFLTMLFLGVLVLEFGSLVMLGLEQNAPGANITTTSDALWFTIATIATVGYGDEYPVTDAGRICGSVIIVIGVGIFGTFTGYLANAFLAPKKRIWGEGPDVGIRSADPIVADDEPGPVGE